MTANKFNAYIRLMRIDKPVGTLLLAWSSLWGLWLAGGGQPPAAVFCIIMLGTWTMRSAGCAVNDLADRRFDGKVKRTHGRPLATGELSVKEALAAAALMLFLSLLLVLQLNWQSLVLAFACAAVAIIYPFCKRFLPTPQAVLGVAFASAILLAHTAILGRITAASFFMFLGSVFWALVYDTYYALVDRDDDIPLNLHSSAIFSQGFERRFIALMAAAMLFCLVIAGILARLGAYYYLGLLAAAALLVQELYMTRRLDRESCFAAFHHNNWVGATIWGGLIIEFLP